MKNVFISVMMMGLLLITGCTDYRDVPSASYGKIMEKGGLKKGVLSPGMHDIGWNMLYDNELVILDAGINTYVENMEFILPDKQILKFKVRFKTRVSPLTKMGEKEVTALFNLIDAGHDNRIELRELYSKLGKDIVERVSRGVVGKYNLDQVREKFIHINAELHSAMVLAFDGIPLVPMATSLVDIKYPESFTAAAQEEQKAKMDIATNAAKEKAKRAMIEEQQITVLIQRNLRVDRAETLRLENNKIKNGLSPMLLAYQKLELEEQRVENERLQLEINLVLAKGASQGNNKVIMIPYGLQRANGIADKLAVK